MLTGKLFASISLALATTVAGPAMATSADAAAGAAANAQLTAGEIRKADTAQGKVAIRHEAIQNLDMPPMTMVFRVSNPDLLAHAQVGEKIRFRAEKKDGAMVVTEIERAN